MVPALPDVAAVASKFPKEPVVPMMAGTTTEAVVVLTPDEVALMADQDAPRPP